MGSITKNGLLVALVASGLVACSSTPQSTTTDTEAFASRLIADKVAVAADAQRQYVALVNEDTLALTRRQVALDTDEVDVDFIGKPQELLQTFAFRYGYRYVESGKRLDLRTVNVRVQASPPIEVLRNIGYQIDALADVVLDKSNKVLRLVYKPQSTDHQPGNKLDHKKRG